MRPHGISHTSFLDYSRDLRQQVTTTFWTLVFYATSSTVNALYHVSVRRASISLSLPLPATSR